MLRLMHVLYFLTTGVQILQLLPLFISSNVFLCYSHPPARLSPERMTASLQLSGVWESFGLNSLKPSLAPPYPPTPIATHPCLCWEGCAFPGQTRPSVTGLLPSSVLDLDPFPALLLPCRYAACPSPTYPSGVLRRSRKSHKTNHAFHLLRVWCGQSRPCCVCFSCS